MTKIQERSVKRILIIGFVLTCTSIASAQFASAFMGLGPTGGGTFVPNPPTASCRDQFWSRSAACSQANMQVKAKPRSKKSSHR